MNLGDDEEATFETFATLRPDGQRICPAHEAMQPLAEGVPAARSGAAGERKFLMDRLAAIEQQKSGLIAEAKAIRRRLGITHIDTSA